MTQTPSLRDVAPLSPSEFVARASEAIVAGDPPAMLELLDSPTVAAPASGGDTEYLEARQGLWRGLLTRGHAVPFERIQRAFESEADPVAHLIAYHLFRVPSLAGPLHQARSAKASRRVHRWVSEAIEQWPDFPYAAPSSRPAKVSAPLPPATMDDAAMAGLVAWAVAEVAPRKASRVPSGSAVADAKEALATKDYGAMLGALESPGLWGTAAWSVRHGLWREVLGTARPGLSIATILLAFAEEPEKVAHIVAYKLYLQKHLAGDLAAAIRVAAAVTPKPALLLSRLERARAEWPDFPAAG